MAWLSKTVISRRRSKSSPELLSLDPATPAFGYSLDMIRMELASATGKGRKTTEFTMAKRAALAAMHTEKVRNTVRAKPLSCHKERTPYLARRSMMSLRITEWSWLGRNPQVMRVRLLDSLIPRHDEYAVHGPASF